jgi:hypothetical protein
VARTNVQELDKQIAKAKLEQQEEHIKLREARDNLLNGTKALSIVLYRELIKVNKKINLFNEEIRIGQRYDSNIKRVITLRKQKERLIKKIINKNVRIRANKQARGSKHQERGNNQHDQCLNTIIRKYQPVDNVKLTNTFNSNSATDSNDRSKSTKTIAKEGTNINGI